MNAPVPAELLARPEEAAEEGARTVAVQRTVWNAPYGRIVIEVIDDEVFVNGDKVEMVGKTVR
jgi:hypothetical protein